MLSADYNTEQKMPQEAIPEKEAILEKLESSAANAESFIEKAKRFATIDKLTPELVRLFIQRIKIGERAVKYPRNSEQSVKIIYRDIGNMDSFSCFLIAFKRIVSTYSARVCGQLCGQSAFCVRP